MFVYLNFRMYTRLITRIETTCSRLGKDDKFQLFVCLAVHDRLLGRIVTDLTKAICAQQVIISRFNFKFPKLNIYSSGKLSAGRLCPTIFKLFYGQLRGRGWLSKVPPNGKGRGQMPESPIILILYLKKKSGRPLKTNV